MKIKLSLLKTRMLMFLLLALFLYLIHLNADPVIAYLNTRMPTLFQILLLVLFLAVNRIVIVSLQTRDAGPTGQFIENQSENRTPLIVEFSFKGIIKTLSFILQIFIFSFLLYFVVKYLFVFYIGFYAGDIILVGRMRLTAILAPVLIVLVFVVYFSVRFLKKIGVAGGKS